MKCKKFVYSRIFENEPKESDLQLIEEELPALQDGEVLCEVQCLSMDPYMRPYVTSRNKKVGDEMINFFVAGKVIESKDAGFSVGTLVRGAMNCKTHAVMKTADLTKIDFLQDLPLSHSVGACGMPGYTAYFGLLEVCNPKEGETVYVNSAAGAVGAIVGQIAKIKGCRVVGSAGSDEKVAYCKSLGFDEVFNYKTVPSIAEALKIAAPNGIDIFFENVGGPGFSTVIKQMNSFGRVSICGCIANYNKSVPEKLEDVVGVILFKQLKIQGFVVGRWEKEWPAAANQLVAWIKEGKIKVKEHVTQGFENIPKAFVELFTGGNFGKSVVMI